jgi:hypothetical protein
MFVVMGGEGGRLSLFLYPQDSPHHTPKGITCITPFASRITQQKCDGTQYHTLSSAKEFWRGWQGRMQSIDESMGELYLLKATEISAKKHLTIIEADILFPYGDSRFSEMTSSGRIPQTKAE